MKDFIENLEDAAEKEYYDMLQPDGKLKCGCGKIFDPDEEGTVVSNNPYAMPICDDCFKKWEEGFDDLNNGPGYGKPIKMYEPCKTCFYTETSGEMLDPCFLCLQKIDIFTGRKKRMFSEWIDGKMNQEQVDEYYDLLEKRFDEIFQNDPEIKRLVNEICKIVRNEK